LRWSRFYNLGHGLGQLIWVFLSFLIDFFLIYISILSWLGIKFHNLFQFVLWSYHDLMTWVTGLISWLGWCFVSLFNWIFLFNFIVKYLVDWELSFIIYFNLLSMRIIPVSWSKFGRLAWVDSTYFSCWILFLISSLNIKHWVGWELNLIIFLLLTFHGIIKIS